jgi:hypothetical protein
MTDDPPLRPLVRHLAGGLLLLGALGYVAVTPDWNALLHGGPHTDGSRRLGQAAALALAAGFMGWLGVELLRGRVAVVPRALFFAGVFAVLAVLWPALTAGAGALGSPRSLGRLVVFAVLAGACGLLYVEQRRLRGGGG